MRCFNPMPSRHSLTHLPDALRKSFKKIFYILRETFYVVKSKGNIRNIRNKKYSIRKGINRVLKQTLFHTTTHDKKRYSGNSTTYIIRVAFVRGNAYLHIGHRIPNCFNEMAGFIHSRIVCSSM